MSEAAAPRALVPALPPGARADLGAALAELRGRRGFLVEIAERLARIIGSAVAIAPFRPPEPLRRVAELAARLALRRAFAIALLGLREQGLRARIEARVSRAAATASGAAGGFVGLPGLLPDVTFTTVLIMRRIAAIAVSEGERLDDPATRAACLEVFALGGTSDGAGAQSDGPELGYWRARFLLQGRPLMLLMSEAAATYGVRLSQKLALQAVPLIGAVGGAAVNRAFFAHYESLARAHFVLRRLEREYGPAAVHAALESAVTPH